jgi:hypothetical protein
MRLVLLVAFWASYVVGLPVHEHDVLKWIHDNPGGYVHPDQEIRLDPETGTPGVFATSFIPKGAILCQVPWKLIIQSDIPNERGQMCCGTVKAVAREMKKGNESSYAPYVNYLLSQPDGLVPSTWSESGRKLLRTLIGGRVDKPQIPPEEPTEWLAHDWHGRCRGSRADKLSAKAAILVVQRSDDNLMIPGKCCFLYWHFCFFTLVFRLNVPSSSIS